MRTSGFGGRRNRKIGGIKHIAQRAKVELIYFTRLKALEVALGVFVEATNSEVSLFCLLGRIGRESLYFQDEVIEIERRSGSGAFFLGKREKMIGNHLCSILESCLRIHVARNYITHFTINAGFSSKIVLPIPRGIVTTRTLIID